MAKQNDSILCNFNEELILETKYIDNSQFWNGFISQLPAYVKSEKAKNGYGCVWA